MLRTRRLIGTFVTFVVAFIGSMICMSALALALTLAVARYTHGLLAAAGGAALLDLTQQQANHLSDQTIQALLHLTSYQAINWPSDGGDAAPFYAPDEISHLQDVSHVMLGLLGLGLAFGIALAVMAFRTWHHRGALKMGLAGGSSSLMLAILGGFIWGWNDFDSMFRVFHETFFPGGNFSFDPSVSALVNLFPLDYWARIGATLVITHLVIYALGFLVHLVRGRRRHRVYMATLRRANTEAEPA